MTAPRHPLYRRLLLGFCIANIATLLVSVFITVQLTRAVYADDPDWPQLAEQASAAYLRGGREALDRWIARRRHEGIDATLIEDGRNLSGNRPPVFRLLPQLLEAESIELRPRHGLLIAGQAVVGSDGVARHLVAVRGRRPPPPRLGLLLVVQIALSVTVIGIVGWRLARSISRPVAAIGQVAQRVADGDLAARVAAPWIAAQDEVGELARDFNRMAMRIESLVTHERGVLQDVSHELRSPLARLHLVLDLAQHAPPEEAAQHFARAEREIQRLDKLIGEALSLSRMEAELPGELRELVDLAALAARRVDEARLEAQARGIALILEVRARPRSRGSSSLLARALDNLLSNAIKFSPDAARVEIALSQHGDHAQLRVRDHGPGVPAEDLPSLFRPFFRGRNAALAEGHGLGLTIVERIVRSHHGSVQARNAEGGGLAVELSLPL